MRAGASSAAPAAGRQRAGQDRSTGLPVAADEGVCATTEELATCERVNPGYMSRVLRLTLLAPDIVEATLNGRQEREVTLGRLLLPCPVQ